MSGSASVNRLIVTALVTTIVVTGTGHGRCRSLRVATGGDWGIALLNGGHVQWGGAVTGVTSSMEVNDGAWYSVAVTRDSDLGEVTVFVNGTEEDTQAGGWVGPLTGPPWLGVANNPCDVQFNRL